MRIVHCMTQVPASLEGPVECSTLRCNRRLWERGRGDPTGRARDPEPNGNRERAGGGVAAGHSRVVDFLFGVEI